MRALAGALALATLPGLALGRCIDDAMIVLDGSGSMARSGYALNAAPRIDQARDALERALPLVLPSRPLGLLTYGAGQGGPCDSIRVRVPPAPGTAETILSETRSIAPQGDTPLADAVATAAAVLEHTKQPATIVVVTDGLDTCSGSVCTTARILANEGQDTAIHVVYFRTPGDILASDEQLWRTPPGCLAYYTGAEFIRVTDVDELTRALSLTLACPLFSKTQPAISSRRKG
ncbi:hypothetical protein PARPLA_01641 [Rhodobacteraceae bacterium THAF1]|uniref:vWA domain-containing protein n=1 Tax=Palleronia sp. THAF1 TaxID=2587842 RepID=UPI000F41158E|nr:VWA domain-containing protein [Palleronia sp. THAF1]QFU07725.1 hypothetical protein FIU81_03450 [Palleronia sp. THAF1]VDC23201.1 hypothetical protein PARPLA_01641 [Rhodobacteraceae bacterium THAF1]